MADWTFVRVCLDLMFGRDVEGDEFRAAPLLRLQLFECLFELVPAPGLVLFLLCLGLLLGAHFVRLPG